VSDASCPGDDILHEIGNGHTSPETDALRAHLDGCERCRRIVVELARERSLTDALQEAAAHRLPDRQRTRVAEVCRGAVEDATR